MTLSRFLISRAEFPGAIRLPACRDWIRMINAFFRAIKNVFELLKKINHSIKLEISSLCSKSKDFPLSFLLRGQISESCLVADPYIFFFLFFFLVGCCIDSHYQ